MSDMKNGCWGKILRINLTERKTRIQELPEKIYKDFLGGTGLAAKIIADEISPDIKPLEPENILIFATGPLNMINIPGAGRWTVASISPQTNLWGEANAGGNLGSKIKKTGFDAIILEGKASSPVYLTIEDGSVNFFDAKDYWGKDTRTATELLTKKFGTEYGIAVIGTAGEKLVPISGIESESKAHGGAHAGRSGMGAVMGSKKVKAILVKGTKPMSVANDEKVKEIIKKIRKIMLDSAFLPGMRENGQPGAMISNYEAGAVPIKNWMQAEWEENVKKLGVPIYNEVLKVKPKACAHCVMGCKRWVKVDDGGPYDHEGPGAEFETLALMGSNLLIDDLKKHSYMNDLCNRYGIDTISTGAIIAMIFELYEKGIIDKKFLDGIEAKWGDADAAIALIRKIGNAEGIGLELGKGTAHIAKMIGGEAAEEASVEIRGLEVAGHDPRAHHSMAVSYATSARGADHLKGWSKLAEIGATVPEIGIPESLPPLGSEHKGFIAAKVQDMHTIHNSMVYCLIIPFSDVTFQLQVDIINTITGWKFTPTDLITVGERINNLTQLINLKRGLTRSQIRLPKRFINFPLNNLKIPRDVPDFKTMIEEYFKVRGWDDNAIPDKEKLKELGIEMYAQKL